MPDAFALFHSFAQSLVLTLLIELTLALIFGMRDKTLIAVLLINIITNPLAVYLNLLSRTFLPLFYPFLLLSIEIAVMLAELGFFIRCTKEVRHPLLFAVTANLISFGCGHVLNLL